MRIFADLELDDKHILDAIGNDRQDEFEKMFRAWYNPLCNYAMGFLRDRDDSEEVVQSVFIQLWEKRKSIEIETSLRSYVYRSVRNSCLNHIKHEKVKSEYASFAKQHAVVSDGTTQHMISEELEVRISKALLKLPEQCRIVFQMSRFEELKYSEIAEKLGISIKTVENQMGKALRIMREQLKDYLPFIALWLKDFL